MSSGIAKKKQPIETAPPGTLGPFERAKQYVVSSYRGRLNRGAFKSVQSYCTFIGYPRSGHSIYGSLLDAHPEIIIAHELDALKFVDAGFGRDQLFSLLLDHSRYFKSLGSVSSGYSYKVPNQFQGEFTTLRVIGDKKGAGTIKRINDRPELLDRLRATIGVPVRFVHVGRNPYDNITTIFTRKQKFDAPPTLAECVEYYFFLVKTVAEVMARVPEEDMLDVRHEDLIADPKAALTRGCRFLGVEPTEEYLADCASILYESPNKSRHKIEWSREQIDDVARRIDEHAFLRGYTFES
jgi:hypothetical protein